MNLLVKRFRSLLTMLFVFIIGVEITGGSLKILSIVIENRLQDVHKIATPKTENSGSENVLNKKNGYVPESISFLWEREILGKDMPPVTQKPKDAPEQVIVSSLSDTYRLVGTIVGRTQKYAFLVSRVGGNVIVKKEGEEIIPGAVISSIKEDVIEISRGGTKELVFLFEKDKEKFLQQQDNSEAIPPSVQSSYHQYTHYSPFPHDGGTRPDLRQVGENTFEVRREYVQASLSDMGALLTSARAIPYIKDGEIKGFRLVNITPGSFYKTIGIQDGDVIKSINGIPISNPQTIMKIFTDIQNETKFEINVERMGRELTLRYFIR